MSQRSRAARDRRRSPSRCLPLAVTISLSLLCADREARSEPSVWAEAADPKLERRTKTLRHTERLVGRARRAGRMGALSDAPRSLLLRDALQRLTQADAATSDDPRLRHQLARALYGLFDTDGDEGHLRAAVGHLRMVAEANAPVTVRAEALNDLAMCHARLGRHPREINAYDRALELEPHAESQAILLANQAEGYMAQGHISRAVSGYRASIAVTPAYALHRIAVTTWWGYAVALDRSGNLTGALEQIAKARSYDPEDLSLQSDSWVYLPDYDEHWYRALGHWQRARVTKEPSARLRSYEQALLSWSAYQRRATLPDPWAALAELRQRQCRAEHRRALARSER